LHVLHSKGAETTFRPSIQSVSTHDVAIVAPRQRKGGGHAEGASAEACAFAGAAPRTEPRRPEG
jgi:hypothetical protein